MKRILIIAALALLQTACAATPDREIEGFEAIFAEITVTHEELPGEEDIERAVSMTATQ